MYICIYSMCVCRISSGGIMAETKIARLALSLILNQLYTEHRMLPHQAACG